MALSRTFLVACLVLLSLSLASPAFAQVAPFAPANSAASPPFTARQALQATTWYGRTLIYGGSDSNNVATNAVYSSGDDGATWTQVAATGLPARSYAGFVTIQTLVNNTQFLLVLGGQDAGGNIFNDMYFSINGVNFINSGAATFSARSQFATVIALPVADQSGNPVNNGLPALFVLGGETATAGASNDVYYTSAPQLRLQSMHSCCCDAPSRLYFWMCVCCE